MRKKASILLAALLLLSILSGCSYMEFEQNLRGFGSGQQPAEKRTETEDGGTSTEADIDMEIDTSTDLDQLDLKQMGDEILINDGIARWSYRVDGVKVYENLEAAGLEMSDMRYIPEGDEGNSFVLVELTVENQEALAEVSDYNIAVFHLLNQELLEDPWKELLPEMCYFSLHENNEKEGEYFHFTLGKGEQMSCQIGWVLGGAVSTGENLILHVGADISAPNFVDLESGSE